LDTVHSGRFLRKKQAELFILTAKKCQMFDVLPSIMFKDNKIPTDPAEIESQKAMHLKNVFYEHAHFEIFEHTFSISAAGKQFAEKHLGITLETVE
jgi:hypothetical protein